ncbi:MAG: tetratricopeptide repeat protein [Kofleriaceae bacterium]|nr:tetratricopeptide repeat protein [Kofleriaceae bacterium]
MTTFERAIELARDGHAHEAEQLLQAAIIASRDGTPARTQALFDLANLFVACGDLRRSVEPLRIACAMTSVDDEHEKARLTGTMNLGEILVQLDELDEAYAVLSAGLEGRRAYYGEQHAGFAYGLEALAQVLRARGELESAVLHINKAVDIFWADGNPRVADAFATRAPIVKAVGGLAFNQLAGLPDELYDRVVQGVLSALGIPAPLQLEVLRELVTAAAARESARAWLPQIHAAISNVAREVGPDAVRARIEALTWLRAHFEATGDAHQALSAVLALVMAEEDAGNLAGAEAHLVDAEARATKIGDPGQRARVGRNHGLFLSQHGRKAEARVRLEAALVDARASGDDEEVGRTAIAQGILVQHLGELAIALPLLDEGIAALPLDHADALMGRSHRLAIKNGGTCGCGDMGGAMSDVVRELVRDAVPPDLIGELEIALPEDGSPNVNVKLTREPTDDELEALNSAINFAVVQLRKSIRTRGLSS